MHLDTDCSDVVARYEHLNKSVCPFCPDITLDPLGHHAVSCRHGGDVVIRRNRLQNSIVELCQHDHLSV